MLSTSTPHQARSRVLRACDKCSRSKQRCDGRRPCHRCAVRDDPCHYTKIVRKRGRHPRTEGSKESPSGDCSRRLRPAGQFAGREPADTSDGSPRDTVTLGNAPPQELSQFPSGPHHGPSLPLDGGIPQADSRAPAQDTGPGSLVDPLHPPFSNNITDPGISKENPTSISSLIDPVITMDGLYPGPLDDTSGPGFDQPFMTSGRVRHWLDGTPSLRSGGSLPGLHQNTLDGGGMNAQPNNISTPPRYPCLEPVLPQLRGILSAEEASEMLEIYFNEQRNSLFKSTSPYALTHVLHPSSVLHPTDPRPTLPTLLVVILFCAAHTADMKIFDPPGARQRIVVELYRLILDLIQPDDADNYFRTSDGWQFYPTGNCINNPHPTSTRYAGGKSLLPEALGSTDIILAVAILTLVISGGHYKADSLRWLNKLIRLVRASGLSLEDQDAAPGVGTDGTLNGDDTLRRRLIAKEERRRLFWLIYCLDRHLALSFNLSLSIQEGTFCVRAPLPEQVWQSLDTADLGSIPTCPLGPPSRISGSGFFEYFLPLASILGHIIDLHHCRNHPLLGEFMSGDAIHRIEAMISQRQQELVELDNQAGTFYDLLSKPPTVPPFSQHCNSGAPGTDAFASAAVGASPTGPKLPLVRAYSTYLLHVFHILLHGKWDPISMMEDKDDWITSERFLNCASHAMSATGVLSQILMVDPELTFMPYLFGIYLLQGSFIFLLFVDRMPELGPNRSVEEVCETIIRAHEVSIVTLDTTFQKNIRKVFRSMLHDAQQAGSYSWDEHKVRRRELLSLYRWTPLANGLAY